VVYLYGDEAGPSNWPSGSEMAVQLRHPPVQPIMLHVEGDRGARCSMARARPEKERALIAPACSLFHVELTGHQARVKRFDGSSSPGVPPTDTAPRGPLEDHGSTWNTVRALSTSSRGERGAARAGSTRLTVRRCGESAASQSRSPDWHCAPRSLRGIMGLTGTHGPGALSEFTGCKRGVRRRLDPAPPSGGATRARLVILRSFD
jgi:hypothetical protein